MLKLCCALCVLSFILPVFWLVSYTNYIVSRMKYEFDQELYQLEMRTENFYHNLENRISLFEKIPKIFHFTWNSPFLNSTDQSNIELRVRKNIQTCLDLHLDWEFKIWTDDMVRNEFPELVDLLIAASIPSVISDVLRMNIIAKYGGIYMDTDFLCVRNFEPFLKQQYCTAFAGSEAALDDNKNNLIVSGGLIGAVQGHFLMKRSAKLVIKNALRPELPVIKTGPYFLGQMVKRYNTSTECFYVYNMNMFYKCDFSQRGKCHLKLPEYEKDPNIYAIHLWYASWIVGLN